MIIKTQGSKSINKMIYLITIKTQGSKLIRVMLFFIHIYHTHVTPVDITYFK
jgi:hypothetical protein